MYCTSTQSLTLSGKGKNESLNITKGKLKLVVVVVRVVSSISWVLLVYRVIWYAGFRLYDTIDTIILDTIILNTRILLMGFPS